MTISDADIILLNAFHDGELDAAESERIRRRLATDPELRRRLEEIREVSKALRGLRPAVRNGSSSPWEGLAKLAVAASVVAAVALAALVGTYRGSPPETVLDWHQHFVDQTYKFDGALVPVSATRWIGQEPDLSSANLTLVDVAHEASGDTFLHYSGLHGCRLTFGSHDNRPDVAGQRDDLLIQTWQVGGQHYSVVAVGMDQDKFLAITALLRRETRRDQLTEEIFASVRSATETAVPCA